MQKKMYILPLHFRQIEFQWMSGRNIVQEIIILHLKTFETSTEKPSPVYAE